MRVNRRRWRELKFCVAASSLLLFSAVVHGQDEARLAPSGSPADVREAEPEIRALADLIRDLQAQVQTLNSQLSELRTEEQLTREEAHALRQELELAGERLPRSDDATLKTSAASPASTPQGYSPPSRTASPGQTQTPSGAPGSEEDQQLVEGKLNDLYQTKVESGSKYRLRLSGLVLLNMFENRGTVENQDYPEIAESPQREIVHVSPGVF